MKSEAEFKQAFAEDLLTPMMGYGQWCYEEGINDAVDGILNGCKEAGEMFREMMDTCLKEDGHGASPTGSIAAFAYFDLRREIVENIVPVIIKDYVYRYNKGVNSETQK